jgi:phospholipid/cholesterol/gamma-HCH transport system substrate-binding protein
MIHPSVGDSTSRRGEPVPSEKQLKWSQLKVGITVLIASITLGILILLMSGTGGLFTPRIILRSYFDNAGGLRVGAPVRLQGVDIGNITAIRVVADPSRHLTPVEVTMKVSTQYRSLLRKDSQTALATAGVLGETYIDINSALANGPEVKNDDELATRDTPDVQDVVRASQSTLQNMDALLKRLDRIVGFVESGQGSIGKVIYDPSLYNRLNATVGALQSIAADVTAGNGSLGKLLTDSTLYDKANATVDKLNSMVDEVNAGKGTVGKLLKDPSLFDNANKTTANIRQLTDDINAGKGALGKLSKDQQFADKLQVTLDKVSMIVTRLDNGEGSAGKFIRDPAFYDNTNGLLVESRSLVEAIRKNPKQYLTIHMKIF